MNILSIIDFSEVNGPGRRTTIWTQGCGKKCFNCYQPDSWSYELNNEYSPVFLANKVRSLNPDGVTLTGGDPFEQPEELLEFLRLIQPTENFLKFGIISFTGYTIEEINESESLSALIPYIDLVIEGRYIEDLRTYNGLHGSSNQRFIWNEQKGRGKDLIDEQKVMFDQDIEVHVNGDRIEVTGFPELNKETKKYLKSVGISLK